MTLKAYRWASYVLAFLLLVATFFRLLAPNRNMLQTYGLEHYLAHLIAFAVVAVPGTLGYPRRGQWIWVVLAVSLLGFTTEYIEHIIAVIGIEWNDVLTDAAGACLGALLAKAVEETLQRTSFSRE